MVAFSTSVAFAHDLVNISVEMDGWTMLPISDAGATTHIIATRNDDEALFTDIDVVLYEKTADGWSGSAYDPTITKEDALVDIANEFGLSDPFNGDWMIDLDQEDVLNYMLPRAAFGKGFFIEDPLYFIAEMLDDPDPLVEAAEMAGVAAGGGAINTGSFGGGVGIGDPISNDCACGGSPCIQYAVAAGADAFLIDQGLSVSEIDDVIGAYLENVPGGGGCCNERITCGPMVTSRWNCSGWVLTDYAPTLGECEWSRNVFRSQTINCVKKCSDCVTILSYSQSRIQSGTAVAITSPAGTAADCISPLNTCNTTGVTEWSITDWAPPPPSCP